MNSPGKWREAEAVVRPETVGKACTVHEYRSRDAWKLEDEEV